MSTVRWLRATAVCLASVVVVAPAVDAHGSGASTPTFPAVLTEWTTDPLPWLGVVVAALAYAVGVRAVNRGHPRTSIPGWRVAAWLAGLATMLVALVSPIDVYADDLLIVHMIQHLLLIMVAVPLLALGAPVTLLLRAASPRTRIRFLLPVLHSRVARIVSLPVLGWLLFAIVMVGSHISPIYGAALENPLLHDAEHLAYLVTAALFWWPIVAADPVPHRLRHGPRLVSLLAMVPVAAAVGLAIYFANSVIYEHYATSYRAWGPTPLVDQQVAGLLMWAAGDVLMLLAVSLVVADWMRADELRSRVLDARARQLADRPG